jgi:hypothetical protein
VFTSSSSSQGSSSIGNEPKYPDYVDPNPISDTNSSSGGSGSGSGTSNGGNGDSGSTTQKEDSVFDTKDAVYDPNGCDALNYRTARDASYNGVNKGENGSDFFSVSGQGLEIRSEHLEGSSTYLDKTWVILFYKTFPDRASLGLQGYTGYLMEGVFYLSYDIAWSDQSIGGIDNTIYIQSNKDTKPACYRLVLNNIVGTLIDVQKVYR